MKFEEEKNPAESLNIVMSLVYLRDSYLCDVREKSLIFYGKPRFLKPSLLGWIKYWRRNQHNCIYYPKAGKVYRKVAPGIRELVKDSEVQVLSQPLHITLKELTTP